MKRIVTLLIVVFSLVGCICAQTQTDSISIGKRNGLRHYLYKGEKIDFKGLQAIMMDDPFTD